MHFSHRSIDQVVIAGVGGHPPVRSDYTVRSALADAVATPALAELFVRLRSQAQIGCATMNQVGEVGSCFAAWLHSLKRSNGRFIGVEDRKQRKQLAHI